MCFRNESVIMRPRSEPALSMSGPPDDDEGPQAEPQFQRGHQQRPSSYMVVSRHKNKC
jgi:hypothetical protein